MAFSYNLEGVILFSFQNNSNKNLLTAFYLFLPPPPGSRMAVGAGHAAYRAIGVPDQASRYGQAFCRLREVSVSCDGVMVAVARVKCRGIG